MAWVAIGICALVALGLFVYHFGFIAYENTALDDPQCKCKQTRFAIWADRDCPIHGEETQ